ncbi:agmatine deiminase family protein [Nitrospirota bacterium]
MIKRELDKLGVTQDVRILPFKTEKVRTKNSYVLSSDEQRIKKLKRKTKMPRGTVWAQDLFEAAKGPTGNTVILTPFIHKWFIYEHDKKGKRIFQDNRFVSILEDENVSALRTPLIFKGGNILVDKKDGVRIAFVGRDVIQETIMVTDKICKSIPEDEVRKRLKEYLNVEKVFIIGSAKQQPLRMFHLDQAMVLLGDGVVGVTSLVDKSNNRHIKDIKRFLIELRTTLNTLGYSIVDMETTEDDVRNYRYYANGVAYKNKESGKREFLFPMFHSPKEEINRETYMNNIRKIEELGYKVIQVPTKANHRHGGIHCMMNVLN